MKTLLSPLSIGTLIFIAAHSYSSAQTLVTRYEPKVAGVPYHGVVVDHEGNVLVFKHFDQLNGEFVGNLAKLDANGNMVAGFNKVITNGTIDHVQVQSDGKILARGDFTTINGTVTPDLVRLNPDGTLDMSFASALGQTRNFMLQSDGKILVIESNNLVRLNTDGSLDPSFSMTGSFYLQGPLAIGPDDHIYFTTYTQVYRLKPNGEDDPDFHVGSGVDQNYIAAIATQSDGKILLAGSFSKYNGIARNSIVRLLPNGEVDTTFNVGRGPEGQVLQIVERANKHILVGGFFDRYNDQYGNLVDLEPDGSLHKVIATVSPNIITNIIESPDGRVTVAGDFTSVNSSQQPFLVKFNSNYTISSSFKPLLTYNNTNGRFLEVTQNGKVFTGAYLSILGILEGTSLIRSDIVLLNALGSFDRSFSASRFLGNNPYIVSTCLQDDGKILLGGFVQNFHPNLVRLNPDGSKDNTFQVGTGPTTNSNLAGMPYEIKVKDDIIYIGGYFEKFDGHASQSMVGLNPDGSIAKTFSALPPDSQVNDFDLQSDGKIIVCGRFPFASGSKSIVRLNTDGSLDDSFALTAFTGNLIVVKVDASDRIYLGGFLMTVNGALANCLVRILPDGNLDTSFNIGSGFDDNVWTLEFLPDSTLAVGGYFRVFDGEVANGFAMLDQSGERIPTPLASFGNTSVTNTIKYADHALFLSGRFVREDYTDVYGTAKVSLLPLTLPEAPDSLTVMLHSDGIFQLHWRDNATNELAYILERAVEDGSEYSPYDTLDRNTSSTMDHGIDAKIEYSYRLKAVSDGGESGYSNVASLTWIPVPEAALTLTVTEQSETEFLLTWAGTASYHDGFIVQRAEEDETAYITLDTVSATTYKFVDAVERDKTYFYRVWAYNQSGSAPSNEVSSIISGLETSELSISIFPVPADKIIFATTDPIKAKGQWHLISTTGQSIPLNVTDLNGITAMDLRLVPSGIYLAHYLDSGRIVFSRRVVVDH